MEFVKLLLNLNAFKVAKATTTLGNIGFNKN